MRETISHVSFHCVRRNVWSPWRVIGVYVRSPGYSSCIYFSKFKDIQRAYAAEVKKAGKHIASTEEFFDKWRSFFTEIDSVISPTIKHKCSSVERTLLVNLQARYLMTTLRGRFAKMAIMLSTDVYHSTAVVSKYEERIGSKRIA